MFDSSEDLLNNIRNTPGTQYFEVDVPGIISLKAAFADEAEDFLWLRKGEDVGAEVIATFLGYINSLADLPLAELMAGYLLFSKTLERIDKDYRQIKKLLDRAKAIFEKTPWQGRKPRDLRILCWPNEETESARPLYEQQGYLVRHYSDERIRGVHRFYLNEKRFCVFLRTPAQRFLGFLGTDAALHNQIKVLFEKEWSDALEPSRRSNVLSPDATA